MEMNFPTPILLSKFFFSVSLIFSGVTIQNLQFPIQSRRISSISKVEAYIKA